MGDWPVLDGSRRVVEAHEILLPVGAPPNIKNAWIEVVAALPADLHWLIVSVRSADPALVDLGIGAAGAEEVMIPDLWGLGLTGLIAQPPNYLFPVSWPAGSRIAARCQTSGAEPTLSLFGMHGGFPGFPRFSGGVIQAMGRVGTTSEGTRVDSGAAPAWRELIASTTRPVRYVVGQLRRSQSLLFTLEGYLEVAVGAAGAEALLFRGPRLRVLPLDEGMRAGAAGFGPLAMSIPAGTRVSARVIGTAGDGSTFFLMILYGGE